MTETRKFYTAVEIGNMFHIDPRTVRANARRCVWPSVEFGPRSIRFTDDHIDQIITLCTKQPQPAPVTRRIGTRAQRRTH